MLIAIDTATAYASLALYDGLCLQAMKLAFEWLPKAYADGNDMTAREKMQNAATIAGLGFGNSNTSLCHALAHTGGYVQHTPRAVSGYSLTVFAGVHSFQSTHRRCS